MHNISMFINPIVTSTAIGSNVLQFFLIANLLLVSEFDIKAITPPPPFFQSLRYREQPGVVNWLFWYDESILVLLTNMECWVFGWFQRALRIYFEGCWCLNGREEHLFLKTFLVSRDMCCRTYSTGWSQTCLGYHLIDQGLKTSPCLINQMVDSNCGMVILTMNMYHKAIC